MYFICIVPIVLLALEVVSLVRECRNDPAEESVIFDSFVLMAGSFLEYLYLTYYKFITLDDWDVQLVNAEKHTLVNTHALLTVVVIWSIGFAGFFILNRVEIVDLPPLVIVLSISAMYLGLIQFIVFTIQVMGAKTDRDSLDYNLLFLPICCGIMAARTILRKIHEWKELDIKNNKIQENKILRAADKILRNANMWPVLAVVLMFPLLGILIAILALFGQAPDSVIKAWTETSEWALSTKQSPPNVHEDMHYLCTVAAGGHRKIVKPIRKGIRHGHEVIVNRQLCIANAFEEVLQEKMPRAHRVIRGFYDKYGFPVAKFIRHKWSADFVYIMMKPLEWIFLIVLYSTDVHPENRIAVQYMGKKYEVY